MKIYKWILLRAQLLLLFSSLELPIFAQNNLIDTEENEKQILNCNGLERWSIKVLTDSLENTINFTPINSTVANLVALTTPTLNIFTYSSMPRTAPVETSSYTVTCNITIKKAETDNDYHLVLSDGTNTLIGEIPDPACPIAAGSPFVNSFLAARNFINANIASGNVTNVNIPPVVVTGIGFADIPHFQIGAAPNHLELHPIIDIHFVSTEINTIDENKLNVSVGPNPFNNSTLFEVSSKLEELKDCKLILFDILGNKAKEIKLPLSNTHEINYTLHKEELKSGMYIYRITNLEKTLYEGKLSIQ